MNVVLSPVRRLTLVALAMLTLSLLVLSTAHAQGGPPPFPYVYEATVYVNGERVTQADDFTLTLRIEQWVSRPADFVDEKFVNLVAGPPDSSYAGKEITFYYGGLKAEQTDIFQPTGGPQFKTIRLDFRGVPVEPTATPTPGGVIAVGTPGASPVAGQTPVAGQPTPTAGQLAPTPAPAGSGSLGVPIAVAVVLAIAGGVILWALRGRG